MTLSTLAVWIHVLMVFWLVSGIVARGRCYALAAKATELPRLEFLVGMGSHFETTMVRPATGAVLLAGLIAAWARGWPVLGFLQGASVNWVLTSLLIYLSIIPVIVFVFVPRGRIFHAALKDARAKGEITAPLRAALHDPAVNAARAYELIMVGVITAIMVTRAF